MFESKLESDCVALAESYGVPSIKLSGASDTGKPDRVFLFPYLSVYMEFKQEGEPLRKLQGHWRGIIERLHLPYYVIDTPAAFDTAFRDCIRRSRDARSKQP
jgi:hypothetical protein